MNILLVPDSFKGSLESYEAAQAIQEGIRRVFPDADCRYIPMADGGEGTTLAVTRALGGTLREVTVTGPLGRPVQAVFGLLPDGAAVLEMAQASGITRITPEERDPMAASTYGTGQLLLAALDAGCRHVYLGIGGSATNDGGMGMAQALGVRFLDEAGQPLAGCGAALERIRTIDCAGLDARLAQCSISVMCDVTNPLCGPEGASAVYGPQKGASPAQIRQLDAGLRHYADLIETELGLSLAEVPGAGAAGGLGAGLMAFCHARLLPGADAILELAGFREALESADLVITGEGCLDASTGFGKACKTVSQWAQQAGVPTLVLAGSVLGQPDFSSFSAVESSVNAVLPLSEAMGRAPELLANAAERAMRLIRLGGRLKSQA